MLEADGVIAFTLDVVEAQLAKNTYDVVTIVQGETSNCVKNVHIPEISKLVKAHGALFVVDAVCTLSTTELLMDEWNIDVCITAGQKGLSSIPGIALIAFSDEAWDVLENRTATMPHWCLDARRAWDFWGNHNYHYTAPVPGLLATHEALRLITVETLEKRIERHTNASLALQAGIEAMGYELYVNKKDRLNSVVAVRVPDELDDRKMRGLMRSRFGVEIASAFGHPIVRIGQMGEQCRPGNVQRTLNALGTATNDVGYSVDTTAGVKAAAQLLEA